MATRIRLRRMGAKKRPFYRVVVADQRAPRDGRFIENIGKYHPLEDPSLIEIDEERALHWLRVGAQPSSQVRNLMVKIGIWDRFVEERPSAADLVRKRTEKPAAGKLSKKAAAKVAVDAEAPAEVEVSVPAEEPVAPEPPAEEPVAPEPPADSAPETDAAAESSLAEDTSDGGAGSASDSGAPSDSEDAAADSTPEEAPAAETEAPGAAAEDVPAEETTEA
jgi:small subunit ribosomal protein S16